MRAGPGTTRCAVMVVVLGWFHPRLSGLRE